MKTIVVISLAVIGLLVGAMLWTSAYQENDPDVLSRNGLHWHPVLTIYVKGEKQSIPANIGLAGGHHPVHTHDKDAAQGVIHLEFEGMVRKEDVMLREFFKNWGKDMRGFGDNMHMTVNGKENTDYDNYVMHDGDTIELHYE